MKVLRMNKKNIFIRFMLILLLLILCSFYLAGVFGMNVKAEEDDASVETETTTTAEVVPQSNTNIQLFQDSVLMDLPRNTESYWFQIPEGTVVGNGCYLNLNMTISNTLINDRSSITLSVNGTNLETKWIYDEITQNDQGWWTVPVPASLLKVGGYNELTITTAQRSIEGDCADIDNPSNWVRFDPNSYFHIDVTQFSQAYLGNLYSFFYDNFDDKFSLQNEYILPQIPKMTDLEGMLKVSSAVGAYDKSKNLLTNQVSLGTSNSSIKNKIYMGISDNWTKASNLLLPGLLNESEGFISVQNNNALITGENESGFEKAIKFFSNNNYLGQITDNKLTVTSDVQDSSSSKATSNETGLYAFADLGYENINLKGAFHQSTTFSFEQPNGLKSGTDSYVNVKFSHSKALLSDNSLITVYMNDVACGSEKLSTSNADGGNVKVKIPEDILNNETIEVRIDVYNYLGKIDCSKDWSDTAWTVINKDSEVYFEPSDAGVYPTLTAFPSFNAENKDDAYIMMGIQSNYNTDTLNLMSILSTKVGQRVGTSLNYSVRTSLDDLTNEDKENNMLLVGSFDKIWIPDEVKTKLGIVPENGNFEVKENISETSETLQGKIIFQVIRSPWNFNKKIYVVTYDKSMEAYAIAFLSSTKNLDLLGDQVSIVDSNGDVVKYVLGDDGSVQDNKAPLTFERIKYTIEKTTGLPIWVIIIAIVLIGINVFVLVKVAKKKNRFEKAAENMGNTSERIDIDPSDTERQDVNLEKDTSSEDSDDNL